MNLEQRLKLDELAGNTDLVALAAELREAEELKDSIFQVRDHSPQWRVRYETALRHWARLHNRFQDEIRQAMA